MNHFDDFCNFVKAKDWMADSLKDELIRKMSAALLDAYTRGRGSVDTTPVAAPVDTIPVAPVPTDVAQLNDERLSSVDFAAHLDSVAYSAARYRNGTSSCIRLLRDRGFSDREIEAIVRSKWARWAADQSGAPFGRVPGRALIDFIYDPKNNCTRAAVAQLVAETDYDKDTQG